MKAEPLLVLALLASVIPWAGCTSPRSAITLDPVGPSGANPTGSTGTLVVYSAFDNRAVSTGDTDRRRFSDYQIFSADGRLLKKVHNDSGIMWSGPTEVRMAPGNYRVVARSDGFGLVTVPVLVAPSRSTAVHLEGGGSWPGRPDSVADAVRLPDGRVVGWRAVTPDSPSR
jgi:hypothetical protein